MDIQAIIVAAAATAVIYTEPNAVPSADGNPTFLAFFF